MDVTQGSYIDGVSDLLGSCTPAIRPVLQNSTAHKVEVEETYDGFPRKCIVVVLDGLTGETAVLSPMCMLPPITC